MCKSSIDETLANVCKWTVMKIEDAKAIVKTGKRRQKFGRLQTLLAHTSARLSGIREDFPQIHAS